MNDQLEWQAGDPESTTPESDVIFEEVLAQMKYGRCEVRGYCGDPDIGRPRPGDITSLILVQVTMRTYVCVFLYERRGAVLGSLHEGGSLVSSVTREAHTERGTSL